MALPITDAIENLGVVMRRYFWLLVVALMVGGVFVLGILVYLFSK
jgi:hypothetical protein